MAALIVLDASVLIAFLNDGDAHHERAMTLLSREIDDQFGAHSLTLAEVLVAPAGVGRLEATLGALRDLEVADLHFSSGAAARLAELRAATHLKLPDCCVLLAVEDAHARLASFDDRLLDAAEGRGVVTLRH